MTQQDWHPADIIAALKKRGKSLASSTLTNALNRHWPKGESLIAEALGIAPEQIWLSRYR
ncbi:helix-turn-helix domain-containing protein [Salmonella enterica]|nr:helix-turn-helix domain-containing protein [Salmonella enterica]